MGCFARKRSNLNDHELLPPYRASECGCLLCDELHTFRRVTTHIYVPTPGRISTYYTWEFAERLKPFLVNPQYTLFIYLRKACGVFCTLEQEPPLREDEELFWKGHVAIQSLDHLVPTEGLPKGTDCAGCAGCGIVVVGLMPQEK